MSRSYTQRMERVLVTGAAGWTGADLIRRLAHRSDLEIIGVDDLEAHVPAEFHQSKLDTLEFANRVLDLAPTGVVHLHTGHRAQASMPMETQTLLGALSRISALRRVVVLSDLAIHGTGPRLPSVLSTQTAATGEQTRYARLLRDMETAFASFATERSDVGVTVVRCPPLFGEKSNGPMRRYLTSRVVPTILGYDPRLQFLHEDDAVALLEHTVFSGQSGTYEVAAPGQIYLSRVLRLGRRIPQPLPERQFRTALRAMRGSDLPEDLIRLLRHGRVIEPQWDLLGFEPRRSCRETIISGYGRAA